MPFAPEYMTCVLNENFEDAKELFLRPQMAIHYAHLVMLAEQGIISPDAAHQRRQALDAISEDHIRAAPYDGTSEDLFCYIERLVTEACGPEIGGRLHTARSRNDIDMTMYRMRQREFILGLLAATEELRRTLIDVADRTRETIFAAHTHTQPAQPTTVAHYMLAVIEQLERDGGRLRAALRLDQPLSAWRLCDYRHRISDRSVSHERPARLRLPDGQYLRKHCHDRLPAGEHDRSGGDGRGVGPRRAGSAVVVHGRVPVPAAERRDCAVQQHHAAGAESRSA